MELTDFSDTFHVRGLYPEDVENIYALCKTNKTYYRYFETAPVHENIMEDLSRAPPGKTADDKYFLGFFQKDQTLITILDLIFDYPKPQVAYIGLSMLDVSEQGRGTGSDIMKGIFKQLANQGITYVRLGCIYGNMGATSFWKHNGFYSLKEQLQAVGGQVDLMEKVL